MKLSKTKSILVIVVKWWDRGPSTSVARSVFRWQWIWFQCQSKDNKSEHVLSFFRTCSEFHLSGCHYKTSHSPKGTNTDLFHTLLALRSAFFFLFRSCFSAIGRQGGKQRISVGEGCEYKGTVMHEMMHALGFFHEQSRTDRDDYVMVLWWNVEPGTMRAKAKSNCMRNNMTKHWNINNQNSQAGYLCGLQSCLVSFSLENNERKATPCKVIQGCLPFTKKNPEILVGNFWSVRTVRVVYHLPKISGLSRRARLDSSYNMKLVRNSRNL